MHSNVTALQDLVSIAVTYVKITETTANRIEFNMTISLAFDRTPPNLITSNSTESTSNTISTKLLIQKIANQFNVCSNIFQLAIVKLMSETINISITTTTFPPITYPNNINYQQTPAFESTTSSKYYLNSTINNLPTMVSTSKGITTITSSTTSPYHLYVQLLQSYNISINSSDYNKSLTTFLENYDFITQLNNTANQTFSLEINEFATLVSFK